MGEGFFEGYRGLPFLVSSSLAGHRAREPIGVRVPCSRLFLVTRPPPSQKPWLAKLISTGAGLARPAHLLNTHF